MDYEKKYKALVEAVKTLKETNPSDEGIQNWVNDNVPELIESEEENIRKTIIYHIKNCDDTIDEDTEKRMLAWLEKQGEKKSIKPKFEVRDTMRTLQEADNGVTYGIPVVVYIDEKYYHCYNELIAIKDQDDYEYPPMNRIQNPANKVKHKFNVGDVIRLKGAVAEYTIKRVTDTTYYTDGWSCGIERCEENYELVEQEPTDKVEPKFHEGDWVVYDHRAYQVVELPKEGYINLGLRGNGKIEFAPSAYCRLWTIQDAKDGDVLVTDNGLAFIYNGYLEEQQWPFAYGGINLFDRFNISDGLLPFTHQKVVPANKEQRDLLFHKMKEAGYEWDAKKKELKGIEQKQSFDIERVNMVKINNEHELHE